MANVFQTPTKGILQSNNNMCWERVIPGENTPTKRTLQSNYTSLERVTPREKTPTNRILQSNNTSSQRVTPREKECVHVHVFKGPHRTKTKSDRFIPTRNNTDVAHFLLSEQNLCSGHPKNEEYQRQLLDHIIRENQPNPKILSFKRKASSLSVEAENPRKKLYSQEGVKRTKLSRHIPHAAEMTLDARDLLDDYYLNLLDWSSSNVLALALGNTVYLWDANTRSIKELMHVGDEGPVTSVCWAADGQNIAIGLNNHIIQLWDTQCLRQTRYLKAHSGRVGALAWNGSAILSSGGGDNLIFNHDVRIRDHVTSSMTAHDQEVCGLKWSSSGKQLASGGNDSLVHIWDVAAGSSQQPSPYLYRLDSHRAAVKALAWCPFEANMLASGGGTNDRCIKFWNTQTGTCLKSVDTQSQVSCLQWSKHEKELLSSHGFSENQLCLWKYPSMEKMTELTGHTSRVLHLAQSPDGYTVASAAGDETLRFWKVFGSPVPAKVHSRAKVLNCHSALHSRNIR